LSATKDIANERRRMADEARSAYQSDILKFATMDPAGRAAIKRIDAKRDRGETLTRSEIELASEFNEFKSAALSSAERLAKAAGADAIFTTTLAEAERTSREATEAAKAVARSELTVKQQIEIVHRIETADVQEAIEPTLREILKQIKAGQDEQMGKAVDLLRAQIKHLEMGKRH
jgi:hypothetical protein